MPILAGTIRLGPGMAASPARPASAGHQGRPAGRSYSPLPKRLRERPAVSGTLARTSADGSQDGSAEPQHRRLAWLTPVNLVIIITTLVALGLRLYYQATRPGFLMGVT